MSRQVLIGARCNRHGLRGLSIVMLMASMPTCGITAATGILWGSRVVSRRLHGRGRSVNEWWQLTESDSKAKAHDGVATRGLDSFQFT